MNKDELLTQCIAEDESVKFLFYDKTNDTQDNIKLSILANALEIAFKVGIQQEQARMTKALRELHKQGWILSEVIEAEDIVATSRILFHLLNSHKAKPKSLNYNQPE